jgi:hypothetical protein
MQPAQPLSVAAALQNEFSEQLAPMREAFVLAIRYELFNVASFSRVIEECDRGQASGVDN